MTCETGISCPSRCRRARSPRQTPSRRAAASASREHALARPRGRELADPPAGDVLVEADADHPPARRVDVHEVVVAVGDRDPVRGRLQHGAVAALGRPRAGARADVLVDDEQPVAEPRRRDLEARGDVGSSPAKRRRSRSACAAATPVSSTATKLANSSRGNAGSASSTRRPTSSRDGHARRPRRRTRLAYSKTKSTTAPVVVADGRDHDGRLGQLVQRRERARGCPCAVFYLTLRAAARPASARPRRPAPPVSRAPPDRRRTPARGTPSGRRRRRARSSTATTASTTFGSNCVPAQRRSSSIAASGDLRAAVGARRRDRAERVGDRDDPRRAAGRPRPRSRRGSPCRPSARATRAR